MQKDILMSSQIGSPKPDEKTDRTCNLTQETHSNIAAPHQDCNKASVLFYCIQIIGMEHKSYPTNYKLRNLPTDWLLTHKTDFSEVGWLNALRHNVGSRQCWKENTGTGTRSAHHLTSQIIDFLHCHWTEAGIWTHNSFKQS